MIARRWAVLGLFLAIASQRCFGQPVPQVAADVSRLLVSAPVIRGEFEQRKKIKGFKNPLVSRGDFLVARERGVIWHTREPFESWLVVTPERIQLRQNSGPVEGKLAASGEPMLREVNEVMLALMAANLPALSTRFRITGGLRSSEGWRLILEPRDPTIAQWMERVELEGAAYVRIVNLIEAQGDSTLIRFSNHSVSASLTDGEAARLD